jgi:hypothetical protein
VLPSVVDLYCEATNDADVRKSLEQAAYAIAYGQRCTEAQIDEVAELVVLVDVDSLAVGRTSLALVIRHVRFPFRFAELFET